jgi:hypothetical protein
VGPSVSSTTPVPAKKRLCPVSRLESAKQALGSGSASGTSGAFRISRRFL